MISRRGLIAGLFAAPAIIRTPGLLMPVKSQIMLAPQPVGTITASGYGLVRYAVLYSENDPPGTVLGWYDYGRTIHMAAGDTFTLEGLGPMPSDVKMKLTADEPAAVS
jgi:hypothetical protein